MPLSPMPTFNEIRAFSVREDRIRKATRLCPDAKRILKTLFPEAFTCEDIVSTLAFNPYRAIVGRLYRTPSGATYKLCQLYSGVYVLIDSNGIALDKSSSNLREVFSSSTEWEEVSE